MKTKKQTDKATARQFPKLHNSSDWDIADGGGEFLASCGDSYRTYKFKQELRNELVKRFNSYAALKAVADAAKSLIKNVVIKNLHEQDYRAEINQALANLAAVEKAGAK